MTRGRFITLEGGEGAGKSTQVKRLASFLESRGIPVVITREVGGSPSAEEIREFWLGAGAGHWDGLTEALLVSAARREHLVRTVWPALEKGAWVVSDRFADSTMVYQGYGQGVDLDQIRTLYRLIAGDFKPDVTFFLDLPVSVGLTRMAARHGPDDRFQQQKEAFHERLREGFTALVQAEPDRFCVVDASLTPDEVTGLLVQACLDRFCLKEKA